MHATTCSRRAHLWVALVLLVGLAAASCSDEETVKRSGPRLSKEQLLAEGNAVCVKLNTEVTAIIDGLVTRSEAPTSKQAQEALRDLVPLYKKAADELRVLNPPESDEKTLDQFIVLYDVAVDKLEEASKEAARAEIFFNSDDDPFRSALEAADRYDLDRCGTGTSRAEQELTAEQRSAATKVPVTSTEYSYGGVPPAVPAGPVLFQFANKGTELHELVVTRLAEGQSLEQLLALVEAADPASESLDIGFASAGPEGSTELGVMTTPGTYALFCTILGRDGVGHYAKGLASTLTVS